MTVCTSVRLAHAAWLATEPQLFFEVDDLTKMAGPLVATALEGSIQTAIGVPDRVGAGLTEFNAGGAHACRQVRRPQEVIVP